VSGVIKGEVESKSRPGLFHRVYLAGPFSWCSCERRSRYGQECRHPGELRGRLERDFLDAHFSCLERMGAAS
jgi:hypothetical protein